ncbi:MAG: hypothetical protein RJA70_2271 [Pseudomonadota bacterium]|jgi:hypothetical protein
MSGGTRTEIWLRRLGSSNPVWLREMKQSARLTRTPVILATITVLTTLLICTVGGIAASSLEPATVGSVVYQVFFSLAFGVVSWLGPGVGALTIASEKSGHTWEALLLTSLSPRRIARGKFAAAYSYVAMYIVMLAPVGALPFLFGGVNAAEVLLGYALLFAFAAVAIGFGLSVSSAISSPIVAMLITVPVAVAISITAYLGLGLALSFGANNLWPGVETAPVWLPSAYTRAEFDWIYVLCLLYTVPVLLGISSWYFYEVTAANLGQENDDRTTGLRKWFLVSAALLLPVFLLPRALVRDRDQFIATSLLAMLAVFQFALLALLLFARDQPTAHARVLARLQREGASPFRRFLSPGITKSGVMVVAYAGLALGGLLVAGLVEEHRNAALVGRLVQEGASALFITAGYGFAFVVFCAGFLVFVRSRAVELQTPRILLVVLLFAATAGPWIVMAIGGAIADDSSSALWLAAPSPVFIAVVVGMLLGPASAGSEHATLIIAATAAACTYLTVGTSLFLRGYVVLRRKAAGLRARVSVATDATSSEPAPDVVLPTAPSSPEV